MRFKFNWGWGIAIFLVCFILLNVYFLFFAVSQKYDMVEDNYYNKTLEYQKKIDEQNKTLTLLDKFEILTNAVPGFILLKYPSDFQGKSYSGKIEFYRPSDRQMDISIDVLMDDNNQQTFGYDKIQKGLWIIKIYITVSEIDYYYEEEVII